MVMCDIHWSVEPFLLTQLSRLDRKGVDFVCAWSVLDQTLSLYCLSLSLEQIQGLSFAPFLLAGMYKVVCKTGGVLAVLYVLFVTGAWTHAHIRARRHRQDMRINEIKNWRADGVTVTVSPRPRKNQTKKQQQLSF